MQSHHMHNEHKTVDNVIQKLKSGFTIALISDAGTPLICDPGYKLISELIINNVKVIEEPWKSVPLRGKF